MTPPGGGRKLAVVVLAAGLSSRFEGHKQLAVIGGKTVIERVVDAIPTVGVEGVYVVVGHDSRGIGRALRGRPLIMVKNPLFRSGMGSSVGAGIRALGPDATAAMLLLGDQPLVTRSLLGRLLKAYWSKGGIVAVKYRGVVGPPVIFPRELFPELERLTGDQGARQVISRHADMLTALRVRTGAELVDVDTVEDLREARVSLAAKSRGGARRAPSRPS